MRYQKVYDQLWHDEKFIGMSMEEKLFWVYLLTCPEMNSIGLYHFTPELAEGKTGIKKAKLIKYLQSFVEKGLVCYDEVTGLLWITKFLKYNPPSGTNQAKHYISIAQQFLPHRFAKAFLILLQPILQALPGSTFKAILTKKQAIIIRDDVKCVYCGKELDKWEDIELDHIIPKSRIDGYVGDRYDQVVTSCRLCNQKKGDRTAEEFGYPFVEASPYSIGEAVSKLIYNKTIRERFAKLCNGLPQALKELNEIDDLINKTTAYKPLTNAIQTPSERHSDSETINRNINQKQETEEDIIARSDKNHSEPTPKEPPFITLPLNVKGEEYPVYEDYIKELQELYPAVDVKQEFREMRGWLLGNKKRRKTRMGIERFITGWLAREQDRATVKLKQGGSTDGNGTRNKYGGVRGDPDKYAGVVVSFDEGEGDNQEGTIKTGPG